MKTKRVVIVFAIAVVTIGADCCDSRHGMLAENEKGVAACRDRGGVAVIETDRARACDDGGHCFTLLARCDFPGQIKLQGEK